MGTIIQILVSGTKEAGSLIINVSLQNTNTMNFGTIKFWNDEKGYGFISPDNSGKDVFVHIKSFKKRSHRPKIGQVVSYDTSLGEKGRLRADNVKYMEEKSSSPSGFSMFTLSVLGAITFLSGISIAAYLGKIPELAVAFYCGASLINFIAYGIDKSAAKQGAWRIQESTLHLFSLAGGWPGAIIAQQKFHHKTKKESFRSVFWVTVILNCCGLLWFSRPGSIQKTIDFIDKF